MLIRDRRAPTTCGVIASITRGTILSWKELSGVRLPITFDEFLECERMVQSDPARRHEKARPTTTWKARRLRGQRLSGGRGRARRSPQIKAREVEDRTAFGHVIGSQGGGSSSWQCRDFRHALQPQ